MITAKLIEDLVKNRTNNSASSLEDIFNNKFYDFNIPRGTGKTTAIREYSKGKSSLKLRGCMSYEDDGWVSLIYPDRFIDNTRGQRLNGLQYHYIVIDEFRECLKPQLVLILKHLLIRGMLAEDFIIVSVRTG